MPSDRGIALITGGGARIGANIARELAADGWSIVVAARTRDQIEAVAEEIGGRAVELDVDRPRGRRAGGRARRATSSCSSRTPESEARRAQPGRSNRRTGGACSR